jgi:hypothetical protein
MRIFLVNFHVGRGDARRTPIDVYVEARGDAGYVLEVSRIREVTGWR